MLYEDVQNMNEEQRPQNGPDRLPLATNEPVEVARPVRDARGRLLPGQRTLNPAGRPARSLRVRTLARNYTREAIETLVAVMRDSGSADARTRAATALLDRGWGRPAQQVRAELSGAPSITLNLPWLASRGVAAGGRPIAAMPSQRPRLDDWAGDEGDEPPCL